MSRKIIGVTVGTTMRPQSADAEQIKSAVEEYLNENPFQSGASAEEAAQIAQNKTDIEKLNTEKLSANELSNAINGALVQAKASGEFDGEPGKDGEDGFSPIATVTQTENGATITITDKNGTTVAEVLNGTGNNGRADGFSPIATVEQTDNGAVITITDKYGTTSATVTNGEDGKDGYTPRKGIDYFDGKDGQPGTDGKDGTSATHSWNGTTLTITSAGGTSSADLKGDKGDTGVQGIQGIPGEKGDKGEPGKDGAAGKDGTNGVSATHAWNGTVLTVTSASGTSSADLKGAKGDKGDKGDTGSQGATGADGKTPVKGTDYWTSSDKAAMVNDLINSDAFKAKADVFTQWESFDYEVTTGYLFFHGWETAFKSNGNGCYIKTDVSLYSKLKLTTYEWGSVDYPFYAFLDANGAVMDVSSGSAAKTYTDHEVDVPVGAVTIILNGRTSNAIGIKGLKQYDIETLNIEKANRIAEWVTVPFDLVAGKLIYADGREYAHSSGGYTTVDVKNYKKVKVIGQQWQLNNFYVCYFYDANNTIISKHGGSTQNKPAELALDVPEGAVKMVVNGTSSVTSIEITAYEIFDMDNLYQLLKPTGLKLMTLGDSITAMGLQSDGWVKYFIEKTGCELVANVAVHGARLHDFDDTVYDGNPVINGADNNHNNVLGNQVQKIINNAYEAPDIIMIAIGTNAGISITLEDMTATYYGTGTSLLPLENVDRTKSAGAYRYCLEKLHSLYPNAIIFWCTPIMGYQATRSAENAMKYAESLRIATEYTGQILIDTIRCGINGVNEVQSVNGEYLQDGLHPNVNGAKKIGYYNASKVKEFLGNNFKEV